MESKKFYNLVAFALIFFIVFFLSTLLSFRIILKGEMVTLPNLVGKTLEEAGPELARRKLSVVQTGAQFDTRWERGKIIIQDPPAGSKLKINETVKVVLSAGTEKVIVPRLIGRTIQNSTQILKEAGLRRGVVSQVHTSRFSAGRILSQYPQPMAEIGSNSPVSLLISQGEREVNYLMPDLIGKKAEAVLAKLKELEFRVEDIRYTSYPGLEPGVTIKQFPPQGYLIQKKYPITIEVSKR